MTLAEARNLGKPWMNEEYRITIIQTFFSRLTEDEIDTEANKLKHLCLKYDFLREGWFISKEKFAQAIQQCEQVSPALAKSVVDALSY
jgi:hypothetical protein